MKVFISYRAKEPDSSLAQEFYQGLRAVGHDVFLAGESIRLGEDWSKRIDQELEQCDYFLVLLSHQSVISEMVTEEVRRAKQLHDTRPERQPRLLPIRVNFPLSAPLNYDLRGYVQRIQHRQWESPADTSVILQEILVLLSRGGTTELTDDETKPQPALMDLPYPHPIPTTPLPQPMTPEPSPQAPALKSQSFGNITISGSSNAFATTQADGDVTLTQNSDCISATSTNLQATLAAIAQLKQHIADSPDLNPIEKATVAVPINVLEAELQKPQPDKSLVEQAIAALKKGLDGVITLAEPVTKVAILVAKAWSGLL